MVLSHALLLSFHSLKPIPVALLPGLWLISHICGNIFVNNFISLFSSKDYFGSQNLTILIYSRSEKTPKLLGTWKT